MTDYSHRLGYSRPYNAIMAGSNYCPDEPSIVGATVRDLRGKTRVISKRQTKKRKTKAIHAAPQAIAAAPPIPAIDMGFARIFDIIRSIAPITQD